MGSSRPSRRVELVGGRPRAQEDDRYLAKTVDLAITLLGALGDSPEELGVSELSRRLGKGKSTLHRTLGTLVRRGLARWNPHTQKYGLGMALYRLGQMALRQFDLATLAQPVLNQLSQQHQETFFLAVLDRNEARVLAAASRPRLLSVRAEPGQTYPLHSTGVGKVLLAFADAKLRDQIIRGGLRARTPRTITDPALLRKNLAQIARDCLAENNQEFDLGSVVLSVPVFDALGSVIAAIAVGIPEARFSAALRRKMVAVLREASDRISKTV